MSGIMVLYKDDLKVIVAGFGLATLLGLFIIGALF